WLQQNPLLSTGRFRRTRGQSPHVLTTAPQAAPRVAEFWQQVVSGLASGGIYASLALALVIVYRSTGVINFAQGEMATFATYLAWTFVDHGISFWPAFALTLAAAFAGGVALE